MQPLLDLRSTVSSLARGLMDISPRTKTNSEDEFGDLATDLNHFLDRIALVVKDLDVILSEVLVVGDRLKVLTKQLDSQCREMREMLFPMETEGGAEGNELELVAARESGVMKTLKTSGEKIKDKGGSRSKIIVEEYNDLLEQLHGSFSELHDSVKKMAESERRRGKNIDRYDLFMNALKEMALLEASMQRVAKNGRETLRRIVQVTEND